MFRNNDIPEEYNKIAEISDNYVIWVASSNLTSGTTYTAYVQYFSPSWLVIPIDNYKISSGTTYTLEAHYNNSGMYSYLDYYDVDFSRTAFTSSDLSFSDSDESRADFPAIFGCQVFFVVLFIWVFHHISLLFKKDGI